MDTYLNYKRLSYICIYSMKKITRVREENRESERRIFTTCFAVVCRFVVIMLLEYLYTFMKNFLLFPPCLFLQKMVQWKWWFRYDMKGILCVTFLINGEAFHSWHSNFWDFISWYFYLWCDCKSRLKSYFIRIY